MKRKTKIKSTNLLYQGKKLQVIKSFDQTPRKHLAKNDPLNSEEQKFKFLYYGITPKFEFRVSTDQLASISSKKKGEIHFDLLAEATWVLEKVRKRFGNGEHYADHLFGPRITVDSASDMLRRYLKENGVEGMMNISWSKDLSCSGRMSWVGPCLKVNKPEARKYNLWLKDSNENSFLRERGILCLADHEIGTHFFRMYNDGLQPWYSNRQKFGLQKLRSASLLQTEEGLASINTLLGGNAKYLFFPALLYYTACKATELTFQELFDHLELYITDSEQRWRYVMRVKRHLPDPGGIGGYGKDQCYFAGAVKILRNLDKIDFDVLFSGKVTLAELPRVKHTARLDSVKLPHFLKDMKAYKKQLRHIANVNGLQLAKRKKSRSHSRTQLRKRRAPKSGSPDCNSSIEPQNKSRVSVKSSLAEEEDSLNKSVSLNEIESEICIGREPELLEQFEPSGMEGSRSGLRKCFSDDIIANERPSNLSHCSSEGFEIMDKEDDWIPDNFNNISLMDERTPCLKRTKTLKAIHIQYEEKDCNNRTCNISLSSPSPLEKLRYRHSLFGAQDAYPCQVDICQERSSSNLWQVGESSSTVNGWLTPPPGSILNKRSTILPNTLSNL